MGKRSNGEGTVFRRKDGRWQGALQLDGKRQAVYGRTRQVVMEKLRALQAQARQAGRLPDAGNMTLGDYLTHWLEQAAPRLRPKTLDDYQAVVRVHVLPGLGGVKLSRLQPLHLARHYAALRKSGVSSFRLEKAHCLLHKALRDALRWGLIASNPASLIDAPKRPTTERPLWTLEQVNVFLGAIRDGQGGRYGPLLGFLLATGCRIGEALGLRWSDVSWEAGTVHIERQVTELCSHPIEGAPKTKAGIRTIALPQWGLELLRRRWLEALSEGQAGRVFCTERGTVPLQGNIRRALTVLCAKLGLPRVRVHDLRHVSLSLLAMAGVPLKVAQARAGHSTARMTLDVYQHVLGEGDLMAAEALEKAIGG